MTDFKCFGISFC